MALNRERITLNPLEESLANEPLELQGDRFGHGIFIQPGGSMWPAAAEQPQVAQSVDTEGGILVATTVGLKPGPALKVQIIEPTDPAGTNYALNPQSVPVTAFAFTATTSSNFTSDNYSISQPWQILEYRHGASGVNYPIALAYAPTTDPITATWTDAGTGDRAAIIAEFSNCVGILAHANGAPTSPAINTLGAGLLVLAVEGSPSGTPTDSMGNTWTQGPSTTGASGENIAIWYCTAPLTSASHTFTATGSVPAVAVAAVATSSRSQAVNTAGNTAASGTTIQPVAIPLATNSIAPNGANQIKLRNRLIRDLNGYDYATLVTTPGLGSAEGVLATCGNLDKDASSANFTMGVWLKGLNGGELLELWLYNGSTAWTKNVTLTPNWQFYTVTSGAWAGSKVASLGVVTPGVLACSFYVTGWCLVPGATLTEAFDGTFPGCSWSGLPHASPSTRPAAGGPRLTAIMGQLESQVKQISLTGLGTIRRTFPSSSGSNLRATYDCVGAVIDWDRTSYMNAGEAQGTLTMQAEPYARGAEVTEFFDNLMTWPEPDLYTVDAGAAANYGSTWSNLTTENRYLYTGGEYPWQQGEVTLVFKPGTTITGIKAGVIVKRYASDTYVEAYVTDNGTNSILNVDLVLQGTRTNKLTSTLAARLVAGTTYAISGRLQQQNGVDKVYAEFYVSPTFNTGGANGTSYLARNSPTTSVGPYNMTPQGGQTDASFLGCITPGAAGIVITPADAAFAFVSTSAPALSIAPYVVRERSQPVLRGSLCGIPGSAPALGRIVVQDCSGNDQFWHRFGIKQQRFAQEVLSNDYIFAAKNFPKGPAVSVVSDATSAFGQVLQTAGVDYSPLQLCTTGTLTHTGTMEVWARVKVTKGAFADNTASNVVTVALNWSTGDLSSWTANTPVTIIPSQQSQSGWLLINLGTVFAPPGQSWQGNIVVAGVTSAFSDVVSMDWLGIFPLDVGGAVVLGSGADLSPGTPNGQVQASDAFIGTGTLFGKVLTTGQSWVTGGATTDFSENSGQLTRTGAGVADAGSAYTGGRFATWNTNSNPNAVYAWTSPQIGTATVMSCILLRYTSTTNFAAFGCYYNGTNLFLRGYKVVSGTVTSLFPDVQVTKNLTYATQLAITNNGTWVASYASTGAGSLPTQQLPTTTLLAAGIDSDFNTGGALASGQSGVYSFVSSGAAGGSNHAAFVDYALTNNAATPANRQLQIQSNQAQKQFGVASWAPVGSYVGQYPRLPAAQAYDSVADIVVGRSRTKPNYVVSSAIQFADLGALDALGIQVNVTPRWLQVPTE